MHSYSWQPYSKYPRYGIHLGIHQRKKECKICKMEFSYETCDKYLVFWDNEDVNGSYYIK
jgi:hypothetical protein